jgi:pyruvate kinase
MNVARLNFSHGDHQTHAQITETLRRVAEEAGKTLAILGDLQGPKLRLGQVGPEGINLSQGDEVVLTAFRGQPAMIHFPHSEIIPALDPGSRLVIGDGEVELQVKVNRQDNLLCTTTVPGLLESRKGVNIPGTPLPISCITEKDRADLKLICRLNLDYVALSFVRSARDLEELRDLMADEENQIPIISKIEKSEAIEHLDEILAVTDGIMVARGDLGIEVPPQEVPLLQKRIINKCNAVGKPVITATQMLQSMIEHPRPTRAEASDVANAILDGTDAVMLSGETAMGNHPVKSVLMMKQIAEITEAAYPYDTWRQLRHNSQESVAEAISAASCDVAEQIGARAIIPATMSGSTARMIARHRPSVPIIAVTPDEITQRRLALVWGVESVSVPVFSETEQLISETEAALKAYNFKKDDTLVLTAGVPFGSSGLTNLVRVHRIA